MTSTSTSSNPSTRDPAATPSSPRSCWSRRAPTVAASCRRRCATCSWRVSPSWPSRPRSSSASRPRPASGSTRPCSPRPWPSTRPRSTTRSANASNRQVLIPDPSAGRERYAFRHALLQEAIYDDLLPGERTRLHAAFARTLEASAAGDSTRAAELAYHWYAAHDLPRALESAAVAGDAAERRYAFPEALAQYERALELWGQVPDAETRVGHDRVELLARAAGVARFHDAARAVALIQTAIRLVDETADPARASLLNERLGRCAWIAGQGEVAKEGYRTALRLIPPEPPSVARARAMAGLAQILMLGARFEESRTWANDALTAARAVGARDVEGHALNTRGIGRGTLGEIDEAHRRPADRPRDRGGGRQRRRHRPGARQPRLRPGRRGPAGGGGRGGVGRRPHVGAPRAHAVLRHPPAVRDRRIPVPARAMGCRARTPCAAPRTSARSGSTRSSSRSCWAGWPCPAAGSPRLRSDCARWRRSPSVPRTSSSSAPSRRA